jgi:hypothetical protein
VRVPASVKKIFVIVTSSLAADTLQADPSPIPWTRVPALPIAGEWLLGVAFLVIGFVVRAKRKSD